MYRRVLTSLSLVGVAVVLTACPTGTVAPSAAPAAKAQVATGSNVTANLAADASTGTKAVTVTFGSVTTAGEVAINTTTTAPALPAGLLLATAGTYFDVTTTATFDKATLCFENDKVTSQSKLYHYTNDRWNDRTTTVAPPKICGDFPSFSPVAIVEGTPASPTPTATAAATPTATAAATPTATPAATPTATGTTAPTPTVGVTLPPTPTVAVSVPPTPTVAVTLPPTPTVAVPFPGVLFLPNASGPVPAGFSRYSATVTDAASGAAVVGACVYTGPPAGCPQKGVNKTDASGFFAVDLPAGIGFAFTIEHPSYNAIVSKQLTAGQNTALTMTKK